MFLSPNAMAMEDAFTTALVRVAEGLKSELKNLEGDELKEATLRYRRGTKNRVVGYTGIYEEVEAMMHQCGKAIEAVEALIKSIAAKVSWAIARDGEYGETIKSLDKKVEAFPVPGNIVVVEHYSGKSTNWAVKRAAGLLGIIDPFTRTALKKSKAFEGPGLKQISVKFSKQTNAYEGVVQKYTVYHTSSWTSKICFEDRPDFEACKLKTRMSLLDNHKTLAAVDVQADRLKEITSKAAFMERKLNKLSKKLALRFYDFAEALAKEVKGTGKLVGAGLGATAKGAGTDTDPRAGIHRAAGRITAKAGEDMLVARESREAMERAQFMVKPDFPAVCAIRQRWCLTDDLDLEVLTDDHDRLVALEGLGIATTTIL
ncbi:hypothetical protein SPFM12_00194 [Salmonella phage SPFM12]|nr:hypothetical protein SPFM12_00194 [Salmonella phage SPFM12]